MNYIKLLTDFTETPGGRYIQDGPFSGELFRETILYPKLKKTLEEGGILIVDIDGTYGLCPGFLDESFLVCILYFCPDNMLCSACKAVQKH